MKKQQRKHIRLRNFDYSSENAYFITICTNEKEHFFGTIKNNEMLLSSIGKMALKFWNEIPHHHQQVLLDQFVVMPNHVHGILILKPVGSRHGVTNQNTNQFSKPIPGSISVIIGQYKAAVTKWCNSNLLNNFQWQPKFHDHVIRNEMEFERIRNYIINNVANWSNDKFYT